MTSWNEEQAKGEQIQRGWEGEVERLRAENKLLRATLDDCATAFESIVADEVAEGRRNSGPAQTSRPNAKRIRALLATSTAGEGGNG